MKQMPEGQSEVVQIIEWFHAHLPPGLPGERVAGHLEDAVNGEEQIALESLCENLHDFEIHVSSEMIGRIASAGRKVGLEPRYWQGLRPA
jgi:hypothetical protein